MGRLITSFKKIAHGESTYDIAGRGRLWLTISGAVVLVSLGAFLIRGFNLGIDFQGGTSYSMVLERSVDVTEVREMLGEDFGVTEATVQEATRPDGRSEILVRTTHIDDASERLAIRAALAEIGGLADTALVELTDVGPTWGREISTKAIRGLVVFLLLAAVYISMRFEPKKAATAMAGMTHALIMTTGVYALVGFEVTPASVIAILTILGYSLYDEVVVFDKVAENSEGWGRSGKSYSEIVNRSVNEVLMRSINTSLTTLLPVGSLLFIGAFLLGAQTLRDLALALFVGIFAGTYSTLFVSAPLIARWKDREPRYRQAARYRAGRPVERAGRPRPRPRPRPSGAAPAAPERLPGGSATTAEGLAGPGAGEAATGVSAGGEAAAGDAGDLETREGTGGTSPGARRDPLRVPRGSRPPRARGKKRGKRRR